MKKSPGYVAVEVSSALFSGIAATPRSRFGSRAHASVRTLWSRSSGAVTGWMNTSRLWSRCELAQSVRATSS